MVEHFTSIQLFALCYKVFFKSQTCNFNATKILPREVNNCFCLVNTVGEYSINIVELSILGCVKEIILFIYF